MTNISSAVCNFFSENCLSKILFYYKNIKSLSLLITIICTNLMILIKKQFLEGTEKQHVKNWPARAITHDDKFSNTTTATILP